MFSEPVVGEKFFGREEVLDLFNKRVQALKEGYRQNIALTGQGLSGKTSILHHFLHSIKEEDIITVYVEVVKEPFRSFSNRLIATLLYNALTKKGVNAGFDLEDLLKDSRESLPKTHGAIRAINAHIDRNELDDAYFSLLSLTSTLKEEINKSCIVILDEFDKLEQIGIKNPFLSFGKVIMTQKDTMYIVSSSRNEVIKKILSEKLSLLFGNFEVVKVAGFDTETSRIFMESRLESFEMHDSLKKFLIAFTGGNPFYLSHLIKKVKEEATERMSNHVDTAVLGEAVMELVYNANGVIHQYLMNFILDLMDTQHRERYMSILTAIAGGRNKSIEIARSLRLKQSEVSKDLLRLSELGFISKNGVFHVIDDPILEFWLKFVYQKRRSVLVDGIFNRAELFNSQIMSYIDDFAVKTREDITARIKELFYSFSNELVQMDSKQFRLPHFTKIDIIRTGEHRQFITASFKGKTWVVQPYEEVVRENDIVDFIKNIKSCNSRVASKIIIPLKGIEENAKLLAKELKISMWDISTLNKVFGIYGKEKVVV